MLIELGISHENFLQCAKIGLDHPEHKKLFENIIACDNFLYFKSLMVMKNLEITQQTYLLYAAQENLNSQNQLTNDEAYNTLLRIKEKTELECALAMSLAVAEEKVKIIGGNEDLEMLKAIEESKKMINNRLNNANTKFDYDDPISIFDRNTLKPRENNNINKPKQAVKPDPLINVNISDNQINDIENLLKSNTKKPKNNFSIEADNVNISSTAQKKSEIQNKSIKSTELSISASNPINYKVDSNSTWKEGLNKQTNIDIAILSSQVKDNKDKNKKDIFDLAGDIGSFKFSEKLENDDETTNANTMKLPNQTSIPDNLFNSSPSANDIAAEKSNKKLLDQKGVSNSEGLSSLSQKNLQNLKENENIKKIDVGQEEGKKEKSQKEISELYKNNINNIGGRLNDNFNYDDKDNIEFNKLDFSNAHSKIDNNADTSDLQKWKNFEKKNVDVGLPDLTNVKSKVNTGLKEMSNIDSEFRKENDELKKKFEQLQKDKENKMKEYREMLLKMKAEKNKEDLTPSVSKNK